MGDSVTSFADVPLPQLAHVAAARAEGFSLEEILAVEGLAAEELRAADLACKEMLCHPDAGPRLFVAYASALQQAEERLARRVQPIDEDLGAWVHFLALYAASEDPISILQDLGLTLPDLARLGRVWKQRIEADRELARRAEKLARGGQKKVALPVLRVEPAKLVPSPHARPKPAPPSPNAPARPMRSKVRDVPPAISGTALSLDVPRGPALPFVEAGGLSYGDKRTVARAPVELSGTALALDVPKGPALPFVETQEPAAQPSPPPAIELSESPRAAISGTALALDVPRGTDMPFEGRKSPKELVSTQLLLEIPRELVRRPLPFSAPAPPELPPKLTLVEHAELTVELAMSPERSAEVLARYRITQADRESLDRRYQAIVSADERRRTAWHDAYHAHYARLAATFNRR